MTLERNGQLKSSHKHHHQILGAIPPRVAEQFLAHWANLPGPWPLEIMSEESAQRFSDAIQYLRRRYKDILGESHIVGHLWLRDMLRRAWDTSDMREREWLCFRFRDTYASMVRRFDMGIEEMRKEDLAVDVAGVRYAPPPITPIEAAVFHFQHQGNRARHCLSVGCPAPYFFASKKSQKYCSDICALPAQRESKRKWWTANRSKLRPSEKKKR